MEYFQKLRKSCINHRSWHCTTPLHFQISYIVLMYGEIPIIQILKVLYLLKKIVRIISCAPLKAHTEPLMFAMRLLSLNDINQYMTAIFMYQCLNCNTPQVFNDFFQKNNILHGHDTRQSNDLHGPYARLNVRKCCFKIHGASTWSNIPILIKQSQSLDVFKNNCSIILLDQSQLQSLLWTELYWWLKC